MSDHSNDESENDSVEPQQEENIKANNTPLDSFATEEEALKYLDKKYSFRFTPEDPDFLEALERPFITPPIVVDYTGRVKHQANRRPNHHHNNRYNNSSSNNNNRRY